MKGRARGGEGARGRRRGLGDLQHIRYPPPTAVSFHMLPDASSSKMMANVASAAILRALKSDLLANSQKRQYRVTAGKWRARGLT
eukprot:1880581-Pleurochrysis_carterae.AAC.1